MDSPLMRYWLEREASDRLANGRACRREARNRQLPDAIGFQWPGEREDRRDG